MVGWHHQLDGHEFEQAPGVGEGQGSLACCSPWGHKESDTTERLNSNNWSKERPVVLISWGLCFSAQAAVTKHRKPGDLNNRNVSLGSWWRSWLTRFR